MGLKKGRKSKHRLLLILLPLTVLVLLYQNIGPTQPYTIGAWYFTAWSSVTDAHNVLAQENIGRYDYWGGLRDNYINPTYQDYQPRKPQIGFYDQIDQRVMDIHIQQAASRGLSYFAFYWFWDDARQEESQLSIPVHRFQSSGYKNLMKFFIAPMRVTTTFQKPHPPLSHQYTSLDSFKNRMVPYIVNTFFKDPSYMTTADGRPIITDWDFGLANMNDFTEGMQYLQQYTLNAIGKTPFIYHVSNNAYDQATIDIYKSKGVEGFHCFGGASNLVPGANQYAGMQMNWVNDAAVKNEIHSPCFYSGFDARPWCMIAPWNCNPTTGVYNKWIVGSNPSTFTNELVKAKTYLDNNPKALKMLTVYAWNEWGEGGFIEPDVLNGTAYIDAIQNVFGLQSVTSSPPMQNLEVNSLPQGFFVNPYDAFVGASYQRLLGRQPSSSEFQNAELLYGANLGRSAPSHVDYLMSQYDSTEFQNMLPTATNSFLNYLGNQLWGRNFSSSELNAYSPYVYNSAARKLFYQSMLYSKNHMDFEPFLFATLGTAPTLTPNSSYNVMGTLDGQSATSVYGWSCDSYDFPQNVQVKLYKDGPASTGTLFATVTADIYREASVVAACGGIPAFHGFKFELTSLPVALKDGLQHQVYAYGVPLSTGRPDVLLNGSPFSVTFPTPSVPPPNAYIYIKNIQMQVGP